MTSSSYFRACFCALAACNPLDDHTMVLHDVDDLLWLKVCQIRSTDEACLVAESSAMLTSTTGSSSASRLGRSRQQHRQEISSFTLRDMQERILRGESALLHLLHHSVPLSSGPQNPSFRKARLLLLCVFSRTRDPLTVTRVSLTRMLLEYCRRALEEHGKLADAVQYYSLLRNLRDHDYGSIFMAQLAHMLLDLRAFSVILGPLPTSTECTSADLTTRYGPLQHQHPCFGFVANPEKFLTKVALAIEGLGDLDDALVLLIYADNHKEGYRLVHDSLLMTALNSSLQTDAGLSFLSFQLLSSVQVIPVSEEKIQECLVTAATYESLLRKLFPLLIPVLREVIQRRQMAEDDLKRSVVPFSTSQPHIVHPSSLSSVLTSFFSSLPFDLPNFGIMDLGRATRGYSSVAQERVFWSTSMLPGLA
ncbi:unnamed protein product [Cyprideis torosa]|uniref:Nuclear pore protein n=1 Tax=Cyprideis torosa TaxID=163714 RepID=A0A7R8W4X4_9CRUS|nr:unnamed protein product [Cyprideis torosa]CAG0884644.1 unnamed protein product [Cyprideis torosa]